jgi:hypothetical protein
VGVGVCKNYGWSTAKDDERTLSSLGDEGEQATSENRLQSVGVWLLW